jgi:hypothetical protein
MRKAVMNLRYDPSANAVMAGAFTKANATRLAGSLGRAPSDGELYIAHVLGQSGAVKLITTAENAPNTNAARLFPHAAHANRSIFFGKQGGARSSAEVYQVLVAKHDGTPTPLATAAAAQAQPAAPAAPATATPASVAAPAIVAMSPTPATASAPTAAPTFSTLFSSDRREAVSPFVRQLWGAHSATSLQPASASAGLPAAAAAQPGAASSSAAIMPAAAVNAAQPAGGASSHPFQFMRPDAPNQGAWPI